MKNITLTEHLNTSINTSNSESEPINESLMVVSALICGSLLASAAKGILETDFMKDVGKGIHNLFTGFGALVGGGKKLPTPGDAEEKELHDLLKKKPSDLTPSQRKRLNELSNKYDTDSILSENELKRLKEIQDSDTDTDTDDEPVRPNKPNKPTTENVIDGLLAAAVESNKNEKDKLTKAKNESMINLLAACSYDENGNELSREDRLKKLKETVGDDGWEEFERNVNETYDKAKDSKEFKTALEEAKERLTKENAKELINDVKERSKKTLKAIKDENEELQKLDNEINDIKQQIDGKMITGDLEEKLRVLKEKQDNLKKNSVVGKAVSAAGGGSTTTQSDPPQKKEKTTQDPPAGEKKLTDYTKDEIKAIQDEVADLDPDNEEDKEKIKEKSKLLKDIKKAQKLKGDLIPKVENPKKGTPYQKKVGPEGGKYYRTKDSNGKWNKTWTNYSSKNPIPKSILGESLINSLSNYLFEQLDN